MTGEATLDRAAGTRQKVRAGLRRRRRAERRLLDGLQTEALEKSIRRLRKQISWRRLDG